MNNLHSELSLQQGGILIELQQYITRYQQSLQSIYRTIGNMIKQNVHEDVTTDQYIILQFINQHESTTASEIAQAFYVGRSAITAIVNRLVEKELIVRKRSEKDRRIVSLMLSERGKKIVKATEEEIYRVLEDKLSHFNVEDIELFLHSIEKLAKLMESEQ